MYTHSQKGFSLIELMVAMTIFSVVMLVSVGALLAIIDANRKAQALQSVMNNLNFALESMSRTIRVGTDYHCKVGNDPTPPAPATLAVPNDCTGGNGGGVLLAVEASNGDPADITDQIVYRFNNGRIERSVESGASGTFIPITAAEVQIDDMRFYVTGTDPLTASDFVQARAVITLKGQAGEGDANTEFNVQASVVQRLLDI